MSEDPVASDVRAAPASYVAGVVHHASWDDLVRCLDSLAAQTSPPRAVLVIDTGVDPARLAPIEAAYRHVRFEVCENRGWGAGVNRVLAWAEAQHPEAPYVLVLNPDVALDSDYASVLVEELLGHPGVAIAGGKLLRPGRTTIDSAGIRLPRHRRPRDRGSDEADRGQYDQREQLFAVSGAAMMVRRCAMKDVAIEGEVVDEDFFAYHDDTDLCWRAGSFGWQIVYQPDARAEHGRGWRRERRFEIAPAVRRHSFKNHYLQILKNETLPDFLVNLPWLLFWEVLRLGFALLRDPAILPAYRDALKAAPGALARRRAIARRRVSPRPGAPSTPPRACYKEAP